jgi:NADP-dependent 3-hydroxy acid dehydrogenase YdfG
VDFPARSTPHTESDMTYAQKKQIIGAIQRLVPAYAPVPQSTKILSKLTQLTNDLVRVYQSEGRLRENPFTEAAQRRIHLYEDLVRSAIADKIILVTGGEGCVGQALLTSLVDLGAKRIISVDKAQTDKSQLVGATQLTYETADLRDRTAVEQIFDRISPQIVFHLAAQRSPGLAEVEIRQTITSNLIGTSNIIHCCDRYKIEKCIFSSTGKASRYYTADVYAGSKKICEWLFAKAALTGKTVYAAVRFTHILDNSLIETKIDRGIEAGLVNLHKPDIDLLPQNVSEANYLLLNGLVEAVPHELKLLIVRDLGCPIDLLELPLYKIVKSGKKVPLYFNGLQMGYDEPFFHGQFDPSLGTEVNPLINAIEDDNRTYDLSRTMVTTKMSAFDLNELDRQVALITRLALDPNFPESQLKALQAKGIKSIATSLISRIPPERLLQVLKCGVNPRLFAAQGLSVKIHLDVLGIFLRSLAGRLECFDRTNPVDLVGLPAIVELLQDLPELATEVAYLDSFVKSEIDRSTKLHMGSTTIQLVHGKTVHEHSRITPTSPLCQGQSHVKSTSPQKTLESRTLSQVE